MSKNPNSRQNKKKNEEEKKQTANQANKRSDQNPPPNSPPQNFSTYNLQQQEPLPTVDPQIDTYASQEYFAIRPSLDSSLGKRTERFAQPSNLQGSIDNFEQDNEFVLSKVAQKRAFFSFLNDWKLLLDDFPEYIRILIVSVLQHFFQNEGKCNHGKIEEVIDLISVHVGTIDHQYVAHTETVIKFIVTECDFLNYSFWFSSVQRTLDQIATSWANFPIDATIQKAIDQICAKIQDFETENTQNLAPVVRNLSPAEIFFKQHKLIDWKNFRENVANWKKIFCETVKIIKGKNLTLTGANAGYLVTEFRNLVLVLPQSVRVLFCRAAIWSAGQSNLSVSAGQFVNLLLDLLKEGFGKEFKFDIYFDVLTELLTGVMEEAVDGKLRFYPESCGVLEELAGKSDQQFDNVLSKDLISKLEVFISLNSTQT